RRCGVEEQVAEIGVAFVFFPEAGQDGVGFQLELIDFAEVSGISPKFFDFCFFEVIEILVIRVGGNVAVLGVVGNAVKSFF
nr:hypothetical protein [Saprospiraceae bacterium]HMQ85735.1 hypothetical protein [Saprospiraceae bacterium]